MATIVTALTIDVFEKHDRCIKYPGLTAQSDHGRTHAWYSKRRMRKPRRAFTDKMTIGETTRHCDKTFVIQRIETDAPEQDDLRHTDDT